MRYRRCPRCNTLNALDSKKCMICSFELSYFFCPSCGVRVEEGSDYCPSCKINLRNVFYVPALLKDHVIDPKFRIGKRENFWTTVYEINPNITKVQVSAPPFRFFSTCGNLYDVLEVERGKFYPVIAVNGALHKLLDVWESLGDEAKINLLIDLVEKIQDFPDLYLIEKLDEVFLDDQLLPFFPVSEEKEKGFVQPGLFTQKLIQALKGSKDSVWEREKHDFVHSDFNFRRFVNWLKRLKLRLHTPMVRYAGISDRGPVRKVNEDAIILLGADEEIQRLELINNYRKCLFVLSDGLGGHEKGEVAAEMIIEGMKREFYRNLLWKKTVEVRDIVECIEVVNNLVYSHNQSSENPSDRMGGTISGLFIDGFQFIFFNVGDSPIFVFEDSSYYEVSQRDVSTKKTKAITQAIGVRTSEELYVHAEELKTPAEKFRILICSDGLTDVVPEDVIFSIVRDDKLNVSDKCEKLIEEAYKRKTTDNVSLILVEVEKSQVIGSVK